MATNAEKPGGGIKRVRRAPKKKAAAAPSAVTSRVAPPRVEPVGHVEVRRIEAAPRPGLLGTATVRERDLITFLRQLIMMLEAGTPILKSLRTLASRGERAGIRALVADMAAYVETGNPLWQAFDRWSRYFTPVEVNLVKASEASGTLVVVLRRILLFRERRSTMRRRVTVALIYPTILIVACFVVVLVISKLVIPQFQVIFDQMGQRLPAFTTNFMAVSNWFASIGWWLIPAVILGLYLVYKLLWVRSPVRRVRTDRLKLKIPVVRRVTRSAAVAEFTRTLALLQRSGLSMMVTLDLVRSAITNRAFAQVIQSVRDSVERGEGIEDPLRENADIVPPVVTDMLVTGEETGSLEQIADVVADTYEEDVEIAVATLGETLLPIIVLFFATIVILLAIALFRPMVDMLNAIGSSGL
jgi:type IV pilus assembly protein PilC